MLIPCLAYSTTLKMGATFSSVASVDIQMIARHLILEDRFLPFLFLIY
jgi:hypothetical protein